MSERTHGQTKIKYDHDSVKETLAAVLRNVFSDTGGTAVTTEKHMPVTNESRSRRIDIACETDGMKYAFEIKTTPGDGFVAQLSDYENAGWNSVLVHPTRKSGFYSCHSGCARVAYSGEDDVITFDECYGMSQIGLGALSDMMPHSVTKEDSTQDGFRDAEEAIIQVLRNGRANAPLIAEETGYSTQYVRERLGRMKQDQIVDQLGHGMYAVNETQVPEQEGVDD
jgi:hypothetical protein